MNDDKNGWGAFFGVITSFAVGAALVLAVGVGILLGYFVIGSGGKEEKSASQKTTAIAQAPANSGKTTSIALAPEFSSSELSATASQNWLTNGGSTMNERYSSLSEINTENVSGLKGDWLTHLGTATSANYSAEGTPLEYDGTIYISTGSDNVFAMSVKTGKILWRYNAKLPSTLSTICCGWDSRGVALGGGMVYISQLNGELVALNQKNGEVEWQTEVASEPSGYTLTAAPLYYDGRVFTSPSGGEFEIRGYMSAYNAKTGKLEWRFYTIPGPGETGHNTWPASTNAWEHGGGGVWNTPSVDPKLKMMYFSTSNASPWDGRVRPGNNLFDSSIVALNVETGKLEWYYQEVHHDVWDYDAPSPTVLFNANVNGKEREAIAEPEKNGFLFVLDRKTGKPIFPTPEKKVNYNPDQLTSKTQPFSPLVFSPQTVSQEEVTQLETSAKEAGTAPKGFKIKPGSVYSGSSITGNEPTAVAPSAAGGDNWPPSSFDQATDDYYVCSQSGAEAFTVPTKPDKYIKGKQDVGLDTTAVNGFNTPGFVTAFDMETGKIAWQRKYTTSCYSGVVSTAGGLVFVGNNNGELEALNAKTGETEWKFQTGAGANAPVAVFSYEGKEYVTMYAGGNALAATAHGDNFWLFSLNGKMGPVAPASAGAGIKHAGEESRQSEEAKAKKEKEAEAKNGKEEEESAGPKKTASTGSAGGATIFKSNCGTCHTLAAAGTSGDVGPNLDQLKPSLATVTHQVINGGGPMPAFGKDKILSEKEVEEVAKYVSSEAGKG